MNLEYRGHAVTIRLFPSATGGWQWALWMSGLDHYEASDEPFGSGRAAMVFARRVAERYIDALGIHGAHAPG